MAAAGQPFFICNKKLCGQDAHSHVLYLSTLLTTLGARVSQTKLFIVVRKSKGSYEEYLLDI